jgi:membrane protein
MGDSTQTPDADAGPPAPRRVGLPWGAILRATAARLVSDQATMVAAGCAFYATLALFPAITMLVFIYGLMFDPVTVEPQLRLLEELVPPEAYALIAGRLNTLVAEPRGTLSLGLGISLAIAFYSASAGTRALLSALNLAFATEDDRGILVFYAIGLVMTLGAILGAVIGIALLVFLPVLIGIAGLDAYGSTLLRAASFAMLTCYLMMGLALLYRVGPAHRRPGPWLSPGVISATLLWLIAGAGLSAYMDHVASYDAMYGPLGAVVAVMMWFWVSAYAVLVGAELDAQIERARASLDRADPR